MKPSLSMPIVRPWSREYRHGAPTICGGLLTSYGIKALSFPIHLPPPLPNSRSLASARQPKNTPISAHGDAPKGLGRRGRGGQSPGRGGRRSSPSTRGTGRHGPSFTGTRSRGGARGSPPAIFAQGQPLKQDAHLAEAELTELVQGFGNLEVLPVLPLRPGWGTLGKPGALRTNFFSVQFKNANMYEYEVAISSKEQIKVTGNMKARTMQLVEQSPQFASYAAHVAHDRCQRLVSAQKLPQPLEVPIEYREEGRADNPNPLKLKVEFKFLSELKMSDLDLYMSGKPEHRGIDTQPHISALNLVLQHFARKNGVRMSRNKYFFPSSSEPHPLSIGVEAFRGFFISTRLVYKQLVANIGLCYSAFYVPGNLAQQMGEFLEKTGRQMPESFANGLKASTRHLGYARTYTIHGVMTGKTAREEHFDCEEFKAKISVEQFFKRKYNITIRRHSDLPLVNVSADNNRPVYLPAEICEIVPGQAYRSKLDAEQTTAMMKAACNQPAFNGKAITNEAFKDLGLRPNAPGAALGSFGISVSPDMQVIPYRVLSPPTISYSGNTPLRVQDAGWNMTDAKFHTGVDMTDWAVLLVNENQRNEFQFRGPKDPELHTFLEAFASKCTASGIKGADKRPRIWSVDLPPIHRDTASARHRDIAKIGKKLTEELKKDPKKKPSFVLVLLPAADKFIYQGIKRLADVQLGVHTVHMLLPTARGSRSSIQHQYFSSVALKVNAKLGGVNHRLDAGSMRWLTGTGKKTTMVMGIDVTHPGTGSLPGTPSLAAVVASVDDEFVQFPASFALQKPDWNKDSKEMVEDLTRMTMERLQLYQQKNKGRLPDRIIVFRDGVSDGQYKHVILHELPKLQAAFKQISPGPKQEYRPKLSIIVCGKRHNARFWAPDAEHATKNGNTLPGTVVDKGITDVYLFDFYLQAHNGLQGHGKATHYIVIYDENNLDADTIQQGTHTASYLYARATKAVSLVPAAYYADIACERGREHLNVLMNLGNGSPQSRSAVDREKTYQTASKMWGQGVHKDLRDSMFYI
ncbi:Argonaute [Ganoderma sinense ZZ0214-1]|uniref:Argonaute n=1 Tax=Ganoderma sinense ZZ0214-1 TaxID=1077348 RepID=A0A2G8RPZ8_9APHY|nr:Argonaute [Ganoderma sinense ZZ0214-1]